MFEKYLLDDFLPPFEDGDQILNPQIRILDKEKKNKESN
jgi:hypothetical protein